MVALERLLIGRTVGGRHAVEELIGRGRGGLVFRARDTQGGGEVALKVLATPQSAEARERYRRVVAGEVRLAAAIGHPNVVAVHALGSDPELDLDFVTFELARGQTLASVLAQRGKPPISLGLRLLSDAAEGLAAGHRAGLLHRDVRPASLYMVRSEAERQVRVKVGGFGIPQLVRRESLLAAPPEVSAYASPEMLANGSARLTPASDVFGLGVIGFQLMTGALPLDDAARRALAEGRAEEVGVPPELSTAVPPHVFAAVLQALRIAPAERYADAGAFAEALREPASRPAVAVPAIFAAPESAPPAPRAEPAAEAAPAAAAPSAPETAAEDAPPSADALQLVGVTPEVAAATEPVETPPSTVDVAPPETFVALAGGLMSMDDAPAAAPVESPDTAASASAEIQEPAAPPAELAESSAPPAESEVAAAPRDAVPVVSTAMPMRSAPLPRAVPPDLELYYPPQPATPPAAVSHTGEAPGSPAATQTRIPASVEASVPATAPIVATPAAAAAAPLPAPAKAPAPAAPLASRPVSIGGKRKPRAGAGTGGFRGSPAMAAGFVLGMLVLGTVGWMATRGTTGADAAATETLVANQLVPGAVTAAAPTAADPGSAPQTAAAPAPDTVAGSAEAREERRRALEEARKRLQDEARKKQQDEQARLALLQQQQAAAQAQPAAPPPAAARPQPIAPPPVQQPVAVTQRPAAPPPAAPAAPPAATPAREEPAPTRAAASNEVYDVGDVEERPRLRNGAEIQRSLQSRYPEQLSAAQVSGSVMASFVVNPDGSVDGSSIRIVSSPNAAFNAPTQSVLRRARFRPATVKGQPVKVQVTMPVQWTAGQ